jgi:hypothetical protein
MMSRSSLVAAFAFNVTHGAPTDWRRNAPQFFLINNVSSFVSLFLNVPEGGAG